MKFNSILFILFLFASITTTQLFGQNKVIFALKDTDNTYDIETCLTDKTDYSKVQLEVIQGSIELLQSFNLVITISPEISYTFTTYNQLRSVDPASWLESHDVFNKFKKIHFEINTQLKSGEKEKQGFDVCIEKFVSRSLNGKKEAFIRIPVFFATDRNDTKDSDLNDRFGGKRSDLKYGVCEVSIPNTHKIGEIESPTWWKFEFSEDPNKHMMLQNITLKKKEDYFRLLSEKIDMSSEKSSFLFVHGYNVSFASAAKRTAQITYDLHFDGEAVFYSWPSQASTTAYTVDESNIEWSQYNMKTFLEDYLTKTTAENVYLVAHSMGNRGLTRALVDLMQEKPELNKKIKEVILAAPDIDADLFKRDIAPKMVKSIKKPITLYVSADDVALKASHQVHGNPRAGDAGAGIVVVDGVETIDASGIDTSFLSHSYFAETHSIIEDILDMIKSGRRAASRQTLELIKIASNVYWKVVRN